VSSDRRRPGFVIAATGLQAEARIAAKSANVRAVAGGGSATCLAALVERAIAEGGRAIASFGIAGALSEELKSGVCLIGSEVVHSGEIYNTDPAWMARLARELCPAVPRRIAGVDQALSTPADKRALNLTTGAAGADMESHIAADLAARHALPFAVIRVIADPVSRILPPAALVGMRPDGTTDIGACLRSLVRNPAQVPDLVAVALDAGRAMRQLLRCVQFLGPGLGFFNGR
jgi:adenosylhomocysteine nucleosidase